MIYNKDEEHTKSMNAPTLNTLWDQRKFYEMLEKQKFKWLPKVYKFNTGLDPLDIYRSVCQMVQFRILANTLITALIIGFWSLLYEESLKLNWPAVKDFPIYTIGCILSLTVHWVMEAKALDAVVASKWKTHLFLSEVYDILPEGQGYENELFFNALVGDSCEVHREDLPQRLKKMHTDRLIRMAREIMDLESLGKKKGLPAAVKKEVVKADLKKLHTTGNKFGLWIARQNEPIDFVYDAAKKSRA